MLVILGCLAFSLAIRAHAEWTVVRLHPSGWRSSGASTGNSYTQGGYISASFSGPSRATLFFGGPLSYVDLHPPDATSSGVNAIDGTRFFGTADFEGNIKAGFWNGVSSSWTSLQPSWAAHSYMKGARHGEQVGWSRALNPFGALVDKATLWRGSANSSVNLHPAQYSRSRANSCFGGQQVGLVERSGWGTTACIWSGTADSIVLIGTGVYDSEALGAANGEQVGTDSREGSPHAALWHGTAASFVDLHPAGMWYSSAMSTGGGQQVGYTRLDWATSTSAAIWSGSVESYIDLGALLPPEFIESSGRAVSQVNGLTYVVGTGRTIGSDPHYEALLWIGPAPDPVTIEGTVLLQDTQSTGEGEPVRIELLQANSAAETHEITLGEGGSFSIQTHLNGPTIVAVKGRHWLRRKSNVVQLAIGGLASAQLSLLNGDCDGDNEVGIGDYAMVSAAYNSTPVDPNWNELADLNDDGSVDIADYAVSSANYGQHGD